MRENRPKKIVHLFSSLSHLRNIKPEKMDKLENACERYLKLEILWDWRLIKTVGSNNQIKYSQKQVSSFDVVMEYARDLIEEDIYEEMARI